MTTKASKLIVFLELRCLKAVRVLEEIMSADKYPSISLRQMEAIIYTCINNSRHLAGKYARIFVRGHYLFWEANSFPRANCELRGTDNVQGQISEHISPQMATIVSIILQIFFATRAVLKIGEYLTIILRNRAEYRLILSRRGRRPSRLKSDDIPRDWAG